MNAKTRGLSILLSLLLTTGLFGTQPGLALDSDPPPQPAYLVYNEMHTVYLGNLARRENDIPPLHWNAQMTDAARWFSWDSVENRPSGYCGHDDTLGRSPWERVPAFGYQGYASAENCFCGYVTPEQAIQGWMDSAGHRANLLNPDHREVGLGYYRRDSDGRGYVTQDFGQDPVYPPVVVENEAINTTSPTVNLYIYNVASGGGFTRQGLATEMMVANDMCFTGASWETYTAEKTWNLEPGTGWRTVYVKTRDTVGRTAVVSDSIYLGPSAPVDDLSRYLAASTTDRVTVYGVESVGLPYVQFSQNWFADDTHDTFALWWGNGERVNDSAALGGTSFRLRPGDGESFAWVWTTEFFRDVSFVGYFRLKVNDNTYSDEIARISVKGGGTEYGPISLRGTDFGSAGVYQEFPIPFVFHSSPSDDFLLFNFWRTGQVDVYVDGVYIFTSPQPVQSPFTWIVPGGNYRGGGIWLRYTDAAGSFSSVQEADLTPERLSVSPTSLLFLVEHGGPPPNPSRVNIRREGCDPFDWNVSDDATWLQAQPTGETVQVSVDPTGLITGTYHAVITVDADAGVLGSPAQIPVTLIVASQVHRVYLPLVSQDPGL